MRIMREKEVMGMKSGSRVVRTPKLATSTCWGDEMRSWPRVSQDF